MSSLLKLPFIVIVGTSFHIVSDRPNPPVPKKERAGSKLRETVLFHLVGVKFLFLALAFIETALVLTEHFWPELNRDGSLYLTPLSAIGALAVLIGALIRRRCYKVLGPMFTFELTIQDDHKLVKHGPYSIVRHPSYSGTYLSALGGLLWYFTPGSILAGPTWIKSSFAIFFFVLFLLVTPLIWLRANEEDRLLRQRFGVEWEDWARQVPYKLVPYLY